MLKESMLNCIDILRSEGIIGKYKCEKLRESVENDDLDAFYEVSRQLRIFADLSVLKYESKQKKKNTVKNGKLKSYEKRKKVRKM